MKTRTILLVPLAVVGLWLIGVQLGYPLWLSGQPASRPAAPNFASETAWIVRPDALPPAVWEGDWAVDVFLIPPRPDVGRAPGHVDPTQPEVRTPLQAQTQDLREGLASLGAVYMPALRMPSPATRGGDWQAAEDDVAASLSAYMQRANRGRAVVFVVPPSSLDLLPALEAAAAAQGQDVSQRFLGVITLGEPVSEDVPASLCNAAVSPECNLVLAVDRAGNALNLFQPRRPGAPESYKLSDPEGEARRLAVYSNEAVGALALGADKMVEPFGVIEVFEPTPILRPGEGEEENPPN